MYKDLLLLFRVSQLTLKVEEAPKLTHLTAERPRMRGRRPPRKYATFHEDDAKEVC